MERRAASLAFGLLIAASPLLAQQVAAKSWLVRGRVCDEAGAPLAGAAIGLMTSRSQLDVAALLKAPATRSDADGRYELDIAGAGSWPSLVVAARDRQACTIRPGVRPPSGEQQLVDAVLVPGVQLIGRVRGPDGAPLVGAHVGVDSSLMGSSNGSFDLRSGAFVNARGIFVVPCVPRSGLRVTIRCAGYVGCTLLAAQESPLDVTLQKAQVVRGRVLDAAGAPVADAPVAVSFVASPPPMTPSRTDAEGRFAVDVPPDVLLRVKVSAGGRTYASELLRGAHDDVTLTVVEPSGTAGRIVKLAVRDAATGESLPKVHVSMLPFASNQAVIALFHRHDMGSDYPGDAAVPLQSSTRCLLVEAPGHGFEMVDIAADGGEEPLVVAMGPEAVITGVVTDVATKQPIAGAFVRALPKGNSSGSGGTLEGVAPISDAQGRYRIEGLRPGEYTVQVHVADRAASQPEVVDLTEKREVTLDLAAPEQAWLEVAVVGEAEARPSPMLRGDALQSVHGGAGFFQHHVPPPQPLALHAPGKVRFGPVVGLRGELLVWVPSRLRSDAGSSLAVAIDGEGARVDLQQLRSVVLTGRVEAADLPTARVAVVAERVGAGARSRGAQATRAGLEAGGQFSIDLLPGSYRLTLIDLLTNLEFHAEADDLEVTAGTPPPVLRPQLHWLGVALAAAPAEGELLVQSLRVDAVPFEVRTRGGPSTSGTVPLVPGVREVRLLVPAGTVTVAASRALERLQRDEQSYRYETLVEQQVTVELAETSLTLLVPVPPGDDELRKQDG